MIDVPQRVAAAVDAGALAVPEREDAVVPAFAAHLGLLRAPDRGRGEVLVEPRHEGYASLVQMALGAKHLRVDAAERRAAIAGNEACRVAARATVELLLHQQKTHDGLCASHQHAIFIKVVSVFERPGAEDGVERGGFGRSFRHVLHLSCDRDNAKARPGAGRNLRRSFFVSAATVYGLQPHRRNSIADRCCYGPRRKAIGQAWGQRARLPSDYASPEGHFKKAL